MSKKLITSPFLWITMALMVILVSWFNNSESYNYSSSLINSLIVGSIVTIIISLLTFSVRKLNSTFSNLILGTAYLLVAILMMISNINIEFKSWSLGFLIPIIITLGAVEVIKKN